MDRKGFIGGSDMPIIAGVNRFKSRLTLWLEKTGRIEPEELDLETRKLAEPYILSVARHKEGLVPIEINKRYGIAPFTCEVDFTWHDGTTTQNGEIKTTNYLWETLPIDYQIQAQYNLGITGRTECKLLAMAGWDQYRSYTIKRNNALISELGFMAKEFWRLIETNTPPEPETASDYDMIDHSGDIIATASMEDMIEDIKNYSEIERKLSSLKDRLKIEIGSHERVISDQGRLLATYRNGRLKIC